MTIPILMKRAVCATAHFTGLSRVVAARYAGRGTIFALHSIVEDTANYLDETPRCSAAKLEQMLAWLKGQGVEFISLDTVVQRLQESPIRRFAAFTFDDGYADNLTLALPIMEKFAAPFTTYVTTGMITRQVDAWWFALDEWIRSQDWIDLPFIGRFECSDRARKKRAYKQIEAAIQQKPGLLAYLRMAVARSGIDCTTIIDREALDEKQLRALAHHPLVTIGGHATTHSNLKQLTSAEVEWEMQANRKFLQEATGEAIDHFAYPFGGASACGLREAKIAERLGFRTAVTGRHGTVFVEHLQHLHALPRIHMACDDTPATLSCKLDGVYCALETRFGNPIAQM